MASSRIAAEQNVPLNHIRSEQEATFNADTMVPLHSTETERNPATARLGDDILSDADDDSDFADPYGSPDSQSEYDDSNDAEPAASDSDDNVELTDINPDGHALPPRPSAPSKKGGCRAQPPIAQPARVLRPVPDRRSRAAAVAAARSQRQGS